ncbi:MAG: TolC family protein [Bacteroidetes bacterium]|nr:TolC family protein [Bacteroidota bacterium]
MKQLTTLLFCLITLSVFGQTQSLTLEQAIDHAMKHNADVKNASLSVEDSKQEVKSIIATGLPQVSVNGNFTHNIQIAAQQLPDFISPAVYGVLISEDLLPADRFKAGEPQTLAFGAPSSLTAMANLNQLLFDGTYFLGLKAAKHYVKMSELLQENTEITAIDNVKKSYYAALITGQNSDLLQQSLSNLNNTLRETKGLYEAGYAEKLDVDRLEFAKSNLETEINNIALQKQILMNMLKVNIGMDVNQSIELTEDLLEQTNINADNFSIDSRIETKIMQQTLLLDSLNIKRYQVGYYPTIRLNATYQQNSFAESAEFQGLGKTWNPGTMYGVNISIPIFDGFYKKSKISQARVAYEKDKHTYNHTRNQLMFQVEQAKMNLTMKQQNLENQKNNKALAQSIYETSKIKFDEGVGSSFELIQAQTDQTQAEIAYSNALYEVIVAQIELQTALGTSQPNTK